mmetsp:Transcript_29851/g.72813  ORF Transcript_29851/g.72813 Transcript_29851/m.72813 type:complete len:211 (+) Transcript_29851:267-899(+)
MPSAPANCTRSPITTPAGGVTRTFFLASLLSVPQRMRPCDWVPPNSASGRLTIRTTVAPFIFSSGTYSPSRLTTCFLRSPVPPRLTVLTYSEASLAFGSHARILPTRKSTRPMSFAALAFASASSRAFLAAFFAALSFFSFFPLAGWALGAAPLAAGLAPALEPCFGAPPALAGAAAADLDAKSGDGGGLGTGSSGRHREPSLVTSVWWF